MSDINVAAYLSSKIYNNVALGALDSAGIVLLQI